MDRPLREDAFTLSADRPSVAAARRGVRERLRRWGYRDDVIDDMALMISELFTNAVEHTRTASITCVLRAAERVLCVEVIDRGLGAQRPSPCLAGPHHLSGRGLALVAAYADEWGVVPAEDGYGHTVWATLRATGAMP